LCLAQSVKCIEINTKATRLGLYKDAHNEQSIHNERAIAGTLQQLIAQPDYNWALNTNFIF
jgi:hypothetical protein